MDDQNLGSGSEESEHEEPIIRDKRRIDPETGKVRQPDASESASAESAAVSGEAPSEEVLSEDDLDILSGRTTAEALAAERLVDLQRVSAEYANYRKRTEAAREVDRERAVSEAIKVLVPVLDDLERAEKHGDLTEGSAFATIAAKLRSGVERLGVVPYGESGEPFDPQIHEAIMQQPSSDVTEQTVADVVETGYRVGSTVVRVAKVVVAVPE